MCTVGQVLPFAMIRPRRPLAATSPLPGRGWLWPKHIGYLSFLKQELIWCLKRVALRDRKV
jgi:hypothetical protein